MRRLRRNWSTTKTDIGKSITRIKKKSTASVADLSQVFGRSNSQPQTQVVAQEEADCPAATSTATEEESPPLPRPPPAHARNGGKKASTWALRQIKRRMTISPLNGSNKKDASTFYLTLTIEKPNSVPK